MMRGQRCLLLAVTIGWFLSMVRAYQSHGVLFLFISNGMFSSFSSFLNMVIIDLSLLCWRSKWLVELSLPLLEYEGRETELKSGVIIS